MKYLEQIQLVFGLCILDRLQLLNMILYFHLLEAYYVCIPILYHPLSQYLQC